MPLTDMPFHICLQSPPPQAHPNPSYMTLEFCFLADPAQSFTCHSVSTAQIHLISSWTLRHVFQKPIVKRWDTCFASFDTRPDFTSFAPTLELDIRMRKEYNTLPSNFTLSYYHEQYKKAKSKYHLNLLLLSPPLSAYQSPNTFSNHPPPLHLPKLAASFESKPSSSNRNFPFHKGTGGDPSSAACLICTWRGHNISSWHLRTTAPWHPNLCQSS